MRERNIRSGASVAGLTLMRLGPELTFLAWNDKGGQDAMQNVMRHINFVTQNIEFQPSLVCHDAFGFV